MKCSPSKPKILHQNWCKIYSKKIGVMQTTGLTSSV